MNALIQLGFRMPEKRGLPEMIWHDPRRWAPACSNYLKVLAHALTMRACDMEVAMSACQQRARWHNGEGEVYPSGAVFSMLLEQGLLAISQG